MQSIRLGPSEAATSMLGTMSWGAAGNRAIFWAEAALSCVLWMSVFWGRESGGGTEIVVRAMADAECRACICVCWCLKKQANNNNANHKSATRCRVLRTLTEELTSARTSPSRESELPGRSKSVLAFGREPSKQTLS